MRTAIPEDLGVLDRLGVTALEGPGSHEACFTRPAELAASFLSA